MHSRAFCSFRSLLRNHHVVKICSVYRSERIASMDTQKNIVQG